MSQLPQFDFTNGELICPSCGGLYLHHERVEVFQRNEDAGEGLHVIVEGLSTKVDTKISGNPSMRRHGLKIYFRCEGCTHSPVISLEQHKGNTYISIN